MSEFQPLVLVVALGALIAAVFFWRKSQALSEDLSEAKSASERESKAKDEALTDAKRKAEELDKARQQAREAKNKLERLKKERHQAKQQGPKIEEEAPTEPRGASTVRIADSKLEAAFREKREAYEKQIGNLRQKLAELQEKERRRKKETERAAQKLMADAASDGGDEAGEPISAEASVEALTRQLQALQRAATGREHELSKALKKADSDAKAAARRAAAHHANYQIIRGQLEMVEDRLAELRRKYEGAKRPTELRRLPESEATASPEPESQPT